MKNEGYLAFRIAWENRNIFAKTYWRIRNKIFGDVIAKDDSYFGYYCECIVKPCVDNIAGKIMKNIINQYDESFIRDAVKIGSKIRIKFSDEHLNDH